MDFKYKDFYNELIKEDSTDDHNKHMERARKSFQDFLDKRREAAPGKHHQEKNDWLWKNDPQYAKVANALFALKQKHHHQDTQKSKYDNDSYYIRFGDIPKEGKSYNFLYKYWEKGVSAYEAKWNNKYHMWEIDGNQLNGEGVASIGELFGFIHDKDFRRPVYLLHGRDMGIQGNDGEPLLDVNSVKILKKLKPDEYFTYEVGPDWYKEIDDKDAYKVDESYNIRYGDSEREIPDPSDVMGEKLMKVVGFRMEDTIGGHIYGYIANNDTAYIVEMKSIPKNIPYGEQDKYKRRGFFKGALKYLKEHGINHVVIKLQSSDTRGAIQKLLSSGLLKNPRDMRGGSFDEHPTKFDIV